MRVRVLRLAGTDQLVARRTSHARIFERDGHGGVAAASTRLLLARVRSVLGQPTSVCPLASTWSVCHCTSGWVALREPDPATRRRLATQLPERVARCDARRRVVPQEFAQHRLQAGSTLARTGGRDHHFIVEARGTQKRQAGLSRARILTRQQRLPPQKVVQDAPARPLITELVVGTPQHLW